MSATIETIDGPMKPAERQVCGACGGTKRPVWVEHDGTLKIGIKCKCGLGLYNWHEKPWTTPERIEKHTGRDKKTIVLDVVRECEVQSNEPVSQASITIVCAGLSIFPEETDGILAELKADGQIYDPGRNGRYKVV